MELNDEPDRVTSQLQHLCWVIPGLYWDNMSQQSTSSKSNMLWFSTYSFVHIGVLCGQGWDGDLIEEELSLVWTDGRVKLVDGLTPVILLAQLLQNLPDRQHTVTVLTRTNSRDARRGPALPDSGPQSQQVVFQNIMS